MTRKEYFEALGRLNDRYMFEQDMTNEEYLQLRKAIEIIYLKTIYKKQ